MNAAVSNLGERHRTFPKSVQPGIPKLGELKPGWKRVRIGELFHVVNRPCQLADAKTYKLVTVKRSRGGIESRGNLMGSEIAVKSQFFIDADDFLISKRQIVHGACAIVSEEFAGSIVSNEYAVLRCKPALDIGFLRQLIHSIYFQQTCFHSSLGVHVEKMIFSTPEWFKWQIDIPALDEQRHIADFLGSVDERIKLLQRRRDALGRYKVGVKQRLFDQSIRFTKNDGASFPDWRDVRFGDVATFAKGRGVSKDDITDDGETPCIRYGELYTAYSERIDRVISATNAPMKGLMLSEMGDVILPASGEMPLDMASASCVMMSGVALGGDINVIRSSISGLFLAYMLRGPLRRSIARLAQGNSVVHLYGSHLIDLKIYIPADAEEQRKIADFLSALDEKISAVSAQIDQMQEFKKGLLQQMFV